MTSGYPPSTVGGGDLVAELASIATQAGPNAGLWPGLTAYRFTAPAGVPAADVAAHARAAREQFLAGLPETASGNGTAHAG